MSWLRRQQDIASLFAVWALLFQVLLGPFAMAGHAFGATSVSGFMCTTRVSRIPYDAAEERPTQRLPGL